VEGREGEGREEERREGKGDAEPEGRKVSSGPALAKDGPVAL